MNDFTGIACGGPADGRELRSPCARLTVPVWTGEQDRDPQSRRYGEPVFAAASYRWAFGAWVYESDAS